MLIPVLSLVPVAAPDWFRSLALYDNRIAFFQLASFLASAFLSLLIAARGAFSYARPVLQARLNHNRSGAPPSSIRAASCPRKWQASVRHRVSAIRSSPKD